MKTVHEKSYFPMSCMIFIKHGRENNKSKRYSYLEKENEPNTFRPIDAHVVDRAAAYAACMQRTESVLPRSCPLAVAFCTQQRATHSSRFACVDCSHFWSRYLGKLNTTRYNRWRYFERALHTLFSDTSFDDRGPRIKKLQAVKQSLICCRKNATMVPKEVHAPVAEMRQRSW